MPRQTLSVLPIAMACKALRLHSSKKRFRVSQIERFVKGPHHKESWKSWWMRDVLRLGRSIARLLTRLLRHSPVCKACVKPTVKCPIIRTAVGILRAASRVGYCIRRLCKYGPDHSNCFDLDIRPAVACRSKASFARIPDRGVYVSLLGSAPVSSG